MSSDHHQHMTTKLQVRDCPLCDGDGTVRFADLGHDFFHIACSLCGVEEEFRDPRPGYGGNYAFSRWGARARRSTKPLHNS